MPSAITPAINEDIATSLPSLPFTIRQLECFVAVAECGAITAAAQKLHASDSAVSDSISALERAVDTTLFHRQRSRGASLTSDGIAALPVARRILTDGAMFSASVGNSQAALVGTVRVGVTGTLASLFLPRMILETSAQYPGLSIEYRLGDLPSLLAASQASEIDLIITYNLDMPPEYSRRTLCATEAMIVVSADHPLAVNSELSLEQIADEPMVLLDITASRVHTLELMLNRGITPRIVHRTADYELCRALVGRGLGYSLLMRREIPNDTWDGEEVRYIPISPPPRQVEILIAWPQDPLPPRVVAVADIAEEIGASIMKARYPG